jgi:polar amino acid transport system substrate-binding protein
MKKILSIILCLVMVLTIGFTFTACNKEKTLYVATNAQFAPFEYKDGEKFVGIDMELAESLAKELNLTLTIQDMEFESVITSIQGGSSDIGLAALTVSEKRLESVDFSDTYYYASQVVIAKKGDTSVDNITTKEAMDTLLKNKKIGYQTGTTADFYVNGDADWGFTKIEGATGIGYDNGALAIIGLNSGLIDYLIIDEMPAKVFVKKNSDTIKYIDVKLTVEEYAIAVTKGDKEMLDKINAALAKFKQDGTLESIIAKYLVDNE